MPRRPSTTTQPSHVVPAAGATMTRADFARNPQAGLRRAQDGGLVITDAQGRPRGIVSVPTDQRRVPDIDD